MSRIKYHRKINYNIKDVILMIFVLILVNTFLILKKFTKQSSEILLMYGKNKSKEISSIVINEAIYNTIYDDNNIKDIVNLKTNSLGQIISISFDNKLI